LPLPPLGLPQVQFDAPRLLAHVYLYEVDLFLNSRTNGSFVRWVDDITAAVPNQERGLRLIRDVDALMHTRGMRLNAGKTHVLSKSEAYRFFQVSENAKVDQFVAEADRRIKRGLKLTRFSNKCFTAFNAFLKKPRFGHNDKVIRRYIGLFTKLKSDLALDYCLANFAFEPASREVSLTYFLALGPKIRVLNMLEEFVTGGYALDEVALCQVAKLLVNWELPTNSALVSRLRTLGNSLSRKTYLRRSPCYLVLSLWLLTKYGTPSQLARMLRRTRELWENSDYLARQVCAAAARFRQASVRDEFYETVRGRGFVSAESVIRDHCVLMSFTNPIPKDVRGYVNNGKHSSTFGLYRILIAMVVLRNTGLPMAYRAQIRDDILRYLTDPVLRKAILAEVP
jgi:hypothetical protein